MKSLLILFFSTLALTRALFAEETMLLRAQSELWGDDSMTHTMAKTMGSPARDEKVVRAQLAGTNDSFLQTGLLFYPEEMRFGDYAGFPAVFFRGTSFANHKKRKCSITVIFAKAHTYTIHCFSPEDSELPEPKAYIHIDGEPSEVTEAAFHFLEPRLKNGLPKMQEAIRKVISASTGTEPIEATKE